MTRTIARCGAAVIAAAAVTALSVPAQAATAADPALVDCSFAAVYDSFDSAGEGLQGYAKRGDHLTVSGGNGAAWQVHVDDGFLAGADGWIATDCVAFLA